MKNLVLTCLFLASLVACKEKTPIYRIDENYIPKYSVGDTLTFLDSSNHKKQLVVISNKKELLEERNSEGGYFYETLRINFQRVADKRIFANEPTLRIETNTIAVSMENAVHVFVLSFILPQVTSKSIRNKTYSKCFTMPKYNDTINPIKVTYDLHEGIISFRDSSQTLWELMPR